jgi:hypothetical protein
VEPLVVTRQHVAVDTLDLDSHAWQWHRLVAHIDDWLASAQTIGGSFSSDTVSEQLLTLMSEVRRVRSHAHEHAAALTEAARAYETWEADIGLACQRAADVVWWLCGRLAPLLTLALGPGVVAGAAGVHLFGAILNAIAPAAARAYQQMSARAWATVLSTPAVVRAVELSLGSLDEALAGVAGVPLPVALALGTAGAGLTTTAGTARLASRLNAIVAKPHDAMTASAGGTTLTQTQVVRTEAAPAQPPRDFAEALQRIPSDADGGAQVRIEQYDRTFVVYIGGTVDGSLGANAQPWDMSSNLAALGGDPSASEAAVRKAMAESGITHDDPVVLVGHSQGGLIAMRIAQASDVHATIVIVAGAPIHRIEPPTGVAVVAFEHRDDVVPALGGPRAEPEPNRPQAHYVLRTALAGKQLDGSDVLPAHHLSEYVETARMSSEVSDVRLESAQRALIQLEPQGTSALWRAKRH